MQEENTIQTAPAVDLDMLTGVPVGVRIRLGKTTLSLGEALKLGPGDLVRLACSVEDPVEVLVGGRVVAEGDIVVVEGNYAVRIERIVNRRDRLQSVAQAG